MSKEKYQTPIKFKFAVILAIIGLFLAIVAMQHSPDSIELMYVASGAVFVGGILALICKEINHKISGVLYLIGSILFFLSTF